MTSQRFEGKNLEEALQNAASAFGVERYQLSYHVVMEKRGFLGGVKRIVIEAEPAETTVDVPVVTTRSSDRPPVRSHDRAPSAALPPRRQRSDRGGNTAGRDRGNPRRERAGRGDGRRGRGSESAQRFEEPNVILDDTPPPPQAAESDEALRVREWCEKLFEVSNLSVEIRTSESEEVVSIRLYGVDAGRFLSRDGELLDSVQVIANKSLIGRDIEKKLEFDCHDFKEQRVESLGQKALQLAELVRADGREQLLPSMSPVERRIVHLALEKDPEVTTESRGDGFYKRVAIILRDGEPSPLEP